MVKKIRLAIIGTGIAFEELHAPSLLDMQDKFEIVALCNRTEERARNVARWLAEKSGHVPDVYTDLGVLLSRDDVDAVDVAVPINVTAPIAMEALRKNKHVFAEKPIAENVQDAKKLLEVYHQQNRVLAIGEHFRYQKQFRQIHDLAESGIVGEVLLFRLNDLHYTYLDDKYPSTAWRREGNFKGGYLSDGGVHTIAGMRAMVASPVVEVHGLAATFNPQLSGPQHDTLLLNMKFANGKIGHVSLGYSAIEHEGRYPKIYGREGTLVLLDDHIEVWHTGRDMKVNTVPLESSGDGYREEWLDFYNAVANGAALAFPPEEALADLQVILAGLESAESGKVVRLGP